MLHAQRFLRLPFSFFCFFFNLFIYKHRFLFSNAGIYNQPQRPLMSCKKTWTHTSLLHGASICQQLRHYKHPATTLRAASMFTKRMHRPAVKCVRPTIMACITFVCSAVCWVQELEVFFCALATVVSFGLWDASLMTRMAWLAAVSLRTYYTFMIYDQIGKNIKIYGVH